MMSKTKGYPRFLAPKKLQPHYPLFVFLPGMDGTGELLRSQTNRLEIGFDVRCLAIPPDDLNNWDFLSSKVVSLIENEIKKHHRPVYLCGESFGACLAIKVILKAPHLIDRMILVNSASSYNFRPWLHWGSYITDVLPDVVYPVSVMSLLPFLASLGKIESSDRNALINAMHSVSQKSVVWRMSLLREFYITPTELSKINHQVLLIAAAFDRLLPSVAEAHRLGKIFPNAHKVVLPNSGHTCLLETDVNLYQILQQHNFLLKEGKRIVSQI